MDEWTRPAFLQGDRGHAIGKTRRSCVSCLRAPIACSDIHQVGHGDFLDENLNININQINILPVRPLPNLHYDA